MRHLKDNISNHFQKKYYGIIVKYDSNGNVLWEKINHEVSSFFNVRETSDGGAIVWAKNYSYFDHSFLLKYDKDGNVLECVVLEFMDETKEKLRTYCNVVSAYKDGYVVIQIVRKTGNYVTDESGDIRAETKVDREIVFKGTEKVFDSDFFESV